MGSNERCLSLFHPFTASAVGISEAGISEIHSQPHVAMLRFLSERGWRCRVEYLTENPRPYSFEKDGLTHRFWPRTPELFPSQNSGRYRYERSLFAWMSTIIAPPDFMLFNMSGYGSRLTRALARACKLRRKPYFTIIGGVNFGTTTQDIRYFENAHAIIAHSSSVCRKLEQTPGLENNRIVLLPLGLDESRFYPVNDRPRLGNPGLLCVSRWQRIKGIHRVVTAFSVVRSHFPEATLHLVGPESDATYAKEIRQQIEQAGLTDSVIVHGTIPYGDLPQMYQKADLSLLLSDAGVEGFGMVIVESMACGTPVVALASDEGGAHDIITHDIDGLLVDEESVGRKSIALLSDRERLVKMGHAARQKVIERYTYRTTALSLEQVLKPW